VVVARFALTLSTNLPLPAGEGRGEGQKFQYPTFSKTDVEDLENLLIEGSLQSEPFRDNPRQTFSAVALNFVAPIPTGLTGAAVEPN
jgi:hypothetical protein